MERSDVNELHFITPFDNVPSILEHGILSNKLVARLRHSSVAMPEIQAKRKNKQIPGAGRLHDYANLYFDAHNPMLSKLRLQNHEICILRIDTAVLNLPEVIIADRNASSDWVRFYSVAEGLSALDKERLFARYWTHSDDPYSEMNHKSLKCAEVLVPNKVITTFIQGAYVVDQNALIKYQQLNIPLPVDVKGDIFF